MANGCGVERRIFRVLSVVLVLWTSAVVAFAPQKPGPKILTQSIVSEGKKRTYYLFVPDGADSPASTPLLLTFHGSGGNGASVLKLWVDVARKAGLIVAGPDARDRQGWTMPEDGPGSVYDLADSLKERFPQIDGRRVYLFGHSAGGVFVLYLALLGSEYFAAAAVDAAAFGSEGDPRVVTMASRKVPFAIFAPTDDTIFPYQQVAATRDRLVANGFPVELHAMRGRGHTSYYSHANEVNEVAWAFLKEHHLTASPQRGTATVGGRR